MSARSPAVPRRRRLPALPSPFPGSRSCPLLTPAQAGRHRPGHQRGLRRRGATTGATVHARLHRALQPDRRRDQSRWSGQSLQYRSARLTRLERRAFTTPDGSGARWRRTTWFRRRARPPEWRRRLPDARCHRGSRWHGWRRRGDLRSSNGTTPSTAATADFTTGTPQPVDDRPRGLRRPRRRSRGAANGTALTTTPLSGRSATSPTTPTTTPTTSRRRPADPENSGRRARS